MMSIIADLYCIWNYEKVFNSNLWALQYFSQILYKQQLSKMLLFKNIPDSSFIIDG